MLLHKFRVTPRLPDHLAFLAELSRNLWFGWHPRAEALWSMVDPVLWEETHHNPVKLLERVSMARVEELGASDSFRHQVEEAANSFHDYLAARKPYVFHLQQRLDPSFLVAFFSMEYCLCEALPIYRGSLGVASGDHLKSASDLNLPLVAVGLLFRIDSSGQVLDQQGWQQEAPKPNEFETLPIQPERDQAGRRLEFSLPIGEREVRVDVWRAQVGRVPLFLLNTDLPANLPEDRAITAELYGGDLETRLRQEIVLGVGGVRALELLGLRFSVLHLNQQQTAFAALEWMRSQVEERGLSFSAAREAVKAGTLFTTSAIEHGGGEHIAVELMARYFQGFPERLGISFGELMALGRVNPGDASEPFCLALLALRAANRRNAVSRAHQGISRTLWQQNWPGVEAHEVPLAWVTRGVHIPSYLSHEMASLFDRYLGPDWLEEPDSEKVWKGMEQMSMTELWRARQRCRERLVSFAGGRLKRRRPLGGGAASFLGSGDLGRGLNPEALTICMGQEFSAARRGELLFRDPGRLARILGDPARPVQVLVAGKAHPQDRQGKASLRDVLLSIRGEELRDHVFFLEDYDLLVARQLVQGADVWLGTADRRGEACGTSGMKAAANGALLVQTLGGWWEEGFDPGWGWAIGEGEPLPDQEAQDDLDSGVLYALLEREIVPLFYERSRDGLPRRWMTRMKASLCGLCPVFNSHRMVEEYMDRFYLPAFRLQGRFHEDLKRVSEDFAGWQERVRRAWGELAVRELSLETEGAEVTQGENYGVRALLALGRLAPDDLDVELHVGLLGDEARKLDGEAEPMCLEKIEGGEAVYRGVARFRQAGRGGFAVRVLPRHPLLDQPLDMGLVLWG